MTHKCFKCQIEKPLSDFHKRNHKYSKLGIYGTCKKCKNAQVKARYKPGSDKAANLKLRFGMTLEEYDLLFVAQNGACAICLKPQIGLNKSLCVDHCHETKVIRGLLCDNCNRAIGQLHDNIDNLRRAIDYLSKDFTEAKVIPITAVPHAYRRKA